MKTVSASLPILDPPARFCKPPSPFSKGSSPPGDNPAPSQLSKRPSRMAGGPPPHPCPDSPRPGRAPAQTLSSGCPQGRRRLETGRLRRLPTSPLPQLGQKAPPNPTPHPELPHCLLRLQETPLPGNSSPAPALPLGVRRHTPPPKPRGNRGRN